MKKTVIAMMASALAAAPCLAEAAPSWCGQGKIDASRGVNDRDLQDDSREPRVVLFDIVQASCLDNGQSHVTPAVLDQVRATWSKRLGMSDADWADAGAWALLPPNKRMDVSLELSSKDLTALTPIDQYLAIKKRFHLNGGNDQADSLYIADALEPELTEVGRFGMISTCLASASEAKDNAVTWAVCDGDIKRFDPTKFATQLRSDTAHPPEARMELRFAMHDKTSGFADHAAAVAKLMKADPAYKTIFDTAEKSRTDWAATIGQDTAALQLVTALDSATFSQSRHQFEGCEEKTAAALKAAVGKLPAKAFAKMNDEKSDPAKGFAHSAGPVLAADPGVQLAAIAYIECQPTTGISGWLAGAIDTHPGQRGPRSAALDKLMTSPVELDDKQAKLVYPNIRTRPYFVPSGTRTSFGGVVKSLTPDDDMVIVEFEKTTFKQVDCLVEHRTNRIESILNDGTLVYETICDKTGIVTHNNTWPPAPVQAAFAKDLKPGTRVSLMNASSGTTKLRKGKPKRINGALASVGSSQLIAVWPNAIATGPTMVLGATLK